MSQRIGKATRGYKGVAMEGVIASWYARNTLPDMDEYRGLAARISAMVREGDSVLEVAPGPGYTVIELAKLGRYRIVGMDISRSFVEMGRRKARDAGVAVDFQIGDAAAMPFADSSFDFVVCRAAFKNFTRPVAAMNEMYRVLRPGGTALIIDLRPDFTPAALEDYLGRSRRGKLDAALTRMALGGALKRAAHSRAELEEFISRTPFTRHEIRAGLIDYEVWLFRS